MKTATISDRIAARIEHLGLSREAVAAAVGVTGNTIDNWRMGSNAPQSLHLVSLAEVLKCSVGYLLCVTDRVK